MKKLLNLCITLCIVLGTLKSIAQTPTPPNGKKWEKIEKLSDEFNGSSLNTSKWAINDPQWEGRRPARFEASSVSVSGGNLKISASKKSNPSNGWTHNGGLVRSKTRNQYGYYEARMKANKTFMSSTFWLINKKNEFTGCDQRVTELDVTENVGINTGGQSWINRNIVTLNANTHSRRPTCNSTPVGIKGNKADIGEPAYAGYHTYGVWWKNAREILFYLDGVFVFQITPAADFNLPMYLRMVVETYDWNPPKAGRDGMNSSLGNRTTFYDWVRSYKLVDDNGGNQNTPPSVSFKTPQNNAQFIEGANIIPVVNASDTDGIANVKLYLNNQLVGQENQAPYQWNSNQLNNIKAGTYTLRAVATDTRGAEGSKSITINVIADTGGGSVDTVVFKDAPTTIAPANSYTFNINYEASTSREIVVEFWSPTGYLASQKETVAKGSGTKSITVTLPSVTIPGSGYIYKAHIRPLGTTWKEAIDRDQIDNVVVEEEVVYVDKVTFKNAPTTIAPANSYTFTIDYEASTNRDIIVEFWSPTGYLASQKETVAKGSGTKSITVTLPSVTTLGPGYIYKTDIRPVGTTWREAIDRDQIDNVVVEEVIVYADKVAFKGASTTISPANSYTFTIDYEASVNREIVVEFWSSTNWLASQKETVAKGSGTKSITVTLPSVTTPGSGYIYKTHIRPVGTTWREAIDRDQVNNVTVVSNVSSQLITNGDYFITATQSDQRLLSRALEKHSAVMHKPGNFDDQKWIFEHIEDNVYTIKNKGTNRYLEVPFSRCANGANVATWINATDNHKKWKIVANANEIYGLKPIHCLQTGLDRAAGSKNANVQIYDYDSDNTNQKWKIIPSANTPSKNTITREVAGLDEDFKISPNPVTEIINIYNLETGAQVNIFDLKGELVLSKKFNKNEIGNTTIDVSTLNNGMYFISINNGSTVKFLKK